MTRPGSALRAICYCRDCQAFARFLGQADVVLDEDRGTPIVATRPNNVHFTQGLDRLAVMSLSDRGLLRWYAGCCNTPIGNTTRDPRISYVSLVDACLRSGSASVAESFGPVRLKVNTGSARGQVDATPLKNAGALLVIVTSVVAARLSGSYRHNPLFTATGAPMIAPLVLSRAERERVTRAD